ncbi:MAG TPA: hypothetical protein VEZ89_16055 [Rubrivivax sp.]|nr:hypothetical protein [Rubrivivax sp.]
MADADIYAFSPLPAAQEAPHTQAPGAAPSTRRRRWPRVLLVAMLAMGLAALLGAVSLLELLLGAQDGWQVWIDGERWDPPFMEPEHAVLGLVAAVAALFALLLVLPMAVLLVLAAVVLAIALAVASAVGSGVLLVLAVASVVLSPVWLPCWLLWLLLRRRRRRPRASMRP